jgi:hypothetical protein
MPNWCDNKVVFSGDKETMQKIREAALQSRDYEFFSKFIPCPDDEKNNWYQWNIENWGTKWDVQVNENCLGEIQSIDSNWSIEMHFQTAWSPPEIFIKTICEKLNISAKLSYVEWGMGFVGVLEVHGADVEIDDCRDVSKESLLYFGYDEEDIEEIFGSEDD